MNIAVLHYPHIKWNDIKYYFMLYKYYNYIKYKVILIQYNVI